ncbi:MAG: AraC family transcriptional regulator [Phycisphaerales bacterium]
MTGSLGDAFEVHDFDLPATAPDWHGVNGTGDYVVLAFARAPVLIEHEGGRPLVADRNAAMLYNPGQRYRRGLLDERGDNCVFMRLGIECAAEAFGAHDARVADRGPAPVSAPRAPLDDAAALQLGRMLGARRRGDRLAADEAAIGVIDAVASASARMLDAPAPGATRPDTRDAHEDLVERARAEVARSIAENRSLASIARAVHASPYHLARVFRAWTGQSIGSYRVQLRLRAAAEQLAETDDTITNIACRTGFASHAHLTTAFRRAFGVTPSAFRRG